MEQDINGKIQKINDEDYEVIQVIESQGMVSAAKWYQENYDCGYDDAIETIRAIRKKYNVGRHGKYEPDIEELFALFEQRREENEKTGKTGSMNELIEWYMDTTGCERNEAMKVLYDATKKFNKANGISKNGCMITILIAITSVLSAYFML